MEYVPARQFRQVEGSLPPSAVEYVPGSQLRQAASEVAAELVENVPMLQTEHDVETVNDW